MARFRSRVVTSDADGNTLSDSSGRTYVWDSQNRMLSCTYNGTTTTFTYISDGSMLVREYKVNTQTDQLTPTASYMPGPTGPICRVDETNQTEGYYPAGVSSTAPLGRGVTHWYIYDGLGSVIGELDDNNNLTASRQYDVYGAPRANTQQGGAATSPQGYVGSLAHVTDASTGGLIYMQARYYDPSLGRFVNEDPKQNGDNWYVYCGDNPVGEVDSTGCQGKGLGLGPLYVEEFVGFLVMLIGFWLLETGNFAAGAAAFVIGALICAYGVYSNFDEMKTFIQGPLNNKIQEQMRDGTGDPGLLLDVGIGIALQMATIDMLCNSIDGD